MDPRYPGGSIIAWYRFKPILSRKFEKVGYFSAVILTPSQNIPTFDIKMCQIQITRHFFGEN